MEGHREARLVDARPERIEVGIRGRAAKGGAGPQVHHAGAALHHPLELRQRVVEIEEREQRHREDAALVVEAPVLVEPAVEGVDVGIGLHDVVLHEVLDADGEGRKEQRRLEPLLVHLREPRVAVHPLGPVGLDHLRAVVALRREVAEHLAQRSGLRRVVEVVLEKGEGLVADQDAVPLLPGHDVDRQIPVLRLHVAREGIARLVVVVIRVEERGAGECGDGLGHVSSSLRRGAPRGRATAARPAPP